MQVAAPTCLGMIDVSDGSNDGDEDIMADELVGGRTDS